MPGIDSAEKTNQVWKSQVFPVILAQFVEARNFLAAKDDVLLLIYDVLLSRRNEPFDRTGRLTNLSTKEMVEQNREYCARFYRFNGVKGSMDHEIYNGVIKVHRSIVHYS